MVSVHVERAQAEAGAQGYGIAAMGQGGCSELCRIQGDGLPTMIGIDVVGWVRVCRETTRERVVGHSRKPKKGLRVTITVASQGAD